MKVAVFNTKDFERDYLKKANQNKHELYFIKEALSVETADLAKGFDCVSIFTNDDASAEVLEKLSSFGIRKIATRSVGYDNVDLRKAAELGFEVANVPEYSPHSIAEFTTALILAMNRKIIRANDKVRNNNFALDDLIGFDLNGKTVGIIGLGKIGSVVARIMHGFGCKILGVDLYQKKELTEKYEVEYVTLNELYKKADIITLHTPLNEHTKYIINKSTIGLMKEGVMIVNTGRGALINTMDVIDALKGGKIGYLGLDVYEKEKGLFFYDHSNDILQDDLFARLLTFKNVLITGHQAFLTENALTNIADTTLYNINCWAKGETSKNELVKKENVHQV